MQGGLAMSCHVLPSWPLRPVFGTAVLEVAGAPHPSGAKTHVIDVVPGDHRFIPLTIDHPINYR
jgi:hypothetical protein